MNALSARELFGVLAGLDVGVTPDLERPVVLRMWMPGGSEAVALVTRIEVSENGTVSLVAERPSL